MRPNMLLKVKVKNIETMGHKIPECGPLSLMGG